MKLFSSFIHFASIKRRGEDPCNEFIQSHASRMTTTPQNEKQSSLQEPTQAPSLHSSSTCLSYRTAVSFSSADGGKTPIQTKSSHEKEKEGGLLMMVLPRQWQDFNVNKDNTNLVDSSSFEEVLSQVKHIDTSSHDEEPSDEFKFDTIVDTLEVDPEELIVSFDLNIPLKEDIFLHLNRNSLEMSNRTLKRLELSASKKISSTLTPFQKKGKGKSSTKMKKKNDSSANLSSKLFTVDGDGDDKIVTNVNTEEFSAMDLCKKLAEQDSKLGCKDRVLMELSIPNVDPDVDSSQTSKNVTKLELDVTSNPPYILSVNTFEAFSSKLFIGVPIVIQTQLIYATRAQIFWFVDHELVLHDSHMFTPQPHHIGKTLHVVVTPYRKGYHGKCFTEAYQFENIIENKPYMPIVTPLRDEFTSVERTPAERRDTIRIVTYNILADLYVSRELEDEIEMYPHTKYEYLQKNRRIPMLVAEILSYDADVICLQEVDGLVYDTYLEPVFQAMGYDGYYSNKASCQREGCAMFWSRKVFERDEALTFSLKELFRYDGIESKSSPSKSGISCPKASFHRWDSMNGINQLLTSHPELRKVTLEKVGQVLQIAKLNLKNRGKDKPKQIVFANTHLFYHPMADHIRAMQAYVVCKKVDEVRRQNNPSPYPFIISGDLNSDPMSGASQLLFTRSVEPDHHDCWKHLHKYQWEMGNHEYMAEHEYIGNECGATDLKYEEEQFQNAVEDVREASKPSAPSICLPGSFPQLVSGCEEMPKFTNFAVDFVDTLDYILASKASSDTEEPFGFVPKRSARMPTVAEVKQFIAMPNEHMPSDHVSIVCDFELK